MISPLLMKVLIQAGKALKKRLHYKQKDPLPEPKNQEIVMAVEEDPAVRAVLQKAIIGAVRDPIREGKVKFTS